MYLEGVRLFASAPPDLHGAMRSFFASLEEGISADSASYLSAALNELGYHATAFCFARQAWEMQPQHLYAGVNALRALRAMDRVHESEVFLERLLMRRPPLNQWGMDRLEEVQGWLRGQGGGR